MTRYEIPFWKDDVTLWNRAIAVTKDNYVARCNLAMIIAEQNPQQAVNELMESVSIYPHYAEAQRRLANLLVRARYYPEAITHGLAAVEANPHDPRPLSDISYAYRQEGDLDNAIKYIQKAMLLDSNSIEYQTALGEMLVHAHRGAEAIPVLTKVVALETNQATVFNNLGAAYMENKQYDQAITNFQMALKIEPDLTNASNNLAGAIRAKAQSPATIH